MLGEKRTVVVERLRQSWLAMSIVGMGAVAAVVEPEVAHGRRARFHADADRSVPETAVPQVAALPAPPVVVDAATVKNLKSLFQERDYSLELVRRDGAAVPRLLVRACRATWARCSTSRRASPSSSR